MGNTVRAAAAAGLPGSAITGAMLDEAAVAHTGRAWDLAGTDLSDLLDPRSIVATRRAEGGAAPAALAAMIADLRAVLGELDAAARDRASGFAASEALLLEQARAAVRAPAP